jgi:acyl-CoA synthetase (AMP-forming)/AMP-acid ligase II
MSSAIEAKTSEEKKSREIAVATTTNTNTVNVANYLKTIADEQPHKRAVVFPFGRDTQGRVAYTHLTFQQLHRDSDSLAYGLSKFGITRNMRTILMVPPSLDFFTLIFAFLKAGIIPVVVDPGMGIKCMLACLKESRSEAIVAVSKVHLLRFLHPGSFKTIKYMVTVGKRRFLSGVNLSELFIRPWKPYSIVKTESEDMAAILFTSGSTGPAKGVIYTHGVFDAQVNTIRSAFDLGSHEIDLPTFPLFSLFDPALAMTAVIPDMDPTHPSKVDPKKIFEAFQNQGINHMFASPALLDRVGQFANRLNLKAPALKKVISAGAPLAPSIIKNFVKLLPKDGEIITGYGATEAMPVTTIGSNEILSKTLPLTQKGFGICIGRPVEGIKVRIIDINDVPISTWSEVKVMQEGEIGEIVVQGDCVTSHYFKRPHDEALAKIKDGDKFWHRMGDLGWRDQHGRLWFCGRKSHRVQGADKTYFTIPCEAIFNIHPRVFRSALVGLGSIPHQKPVMCIELNANDNSQSKKALTKELLKLAKTNILTEDIDTILYHKEFPVDIRHNAKIFREKLASWAAGKVKI